MKKCIREKKERIRVERHIITICESSSETWLQFWWLMVAVLIHWEWGKPTKHKVEWVNILSSWGEEFYTVWCNILGGFDDLWPLLRHCSCLSSAQLSELWPVGECSRTSPERSIHIWANYLRESPGVIKSTISPCRICLLLASSFSWLKPQLVAPMVEVHPLCMWVLLCPRSAEHSVAFANGQLFWVIAINIPVSHALLM